MFRCGLCHKSSQPKERANKIVTETRPKLYEVPQSERPRVRTEWSFTEIVKEILVCLSCTKKLEKANE